MAEKTLAAKQAQKKYMEKYVIAHVRMDRERMSKVKDAAQRAGLSLSAYVNKAIDDKMEHDGVDK